jgi:Matrixin
MPISTRPGLAVLLALCGTVPVVAYVLEERPTVTFPSPVPRVLDGGFAVLHWPAGKPVPFLINPANPGLPLIVPPGRDRDEEFVRVIRRTFERWEDVETNTLRYQFAGLTDNSAGIFDGKSVVGWSLPGQCPPFAAAFNIAFRFQLSARVDSASPVIVDAFINAAPFVFDHGNGQVVEVREPGQIVESDTVICSEVPFSTNLAPFAWDLEGVALHEQGHFSGLNHSQFRTATMMSCGQPQEGRLDDTDERTLARDDLAGVSQLYPANKFDKSGMIEGRVTIGSLFAGLPSPPPFLGIPLAPGSPAYGVHVVAVNAHGLVEAAAMTRPDGRFTIRGLAGTAPYKLILTPLGISDTQQALYPRGTMLRLGRLIYWRPQEVAGIRLGTSVQLAVDDALPSRGDAFGIGDIAPPPPSLEVVSFLREDQLGIFLDFDCAVVLKRGQTFGDGRELFPGGETFPPIFEGSLVIQATASTELFLDALNNGPWSADLGPDISVFSPDRISFFGPPDGSLTNMLYFVRARVDMHARQGFRNIEIRNRLGRRILLIPGVIEVQ